MKRRRLLVVRQGLLVAGLLLAAAARPGRAQESDGDFFEKNVRPVLVDRCYKCHAVAKPKGGLRVDSREALLAGGGSGPALVPGDPEKSLLVAAIRWTDQDLRMPPKRRLEPAQVDALVEWVRRGAPMPRETAVAAIGTHWAFEPVRDPPLPRVAREAWVRDPLDRFVLAGLEAKGLAPSPEADRRTLLRRASFDLLGLPPGPEEVLAFEQDGAPDAWEKVVDRLLASPRFGERWGRHWLDVARYSDTKGYLFEEERRYPYAYTYRDWVVRAFNEDLPYDRFVIDQIAADRLVQGDDRHDLAAMGFLTLGRRFLNDTHLIIDDRIDVVTRGIMGLTVGCARCHDHKFDPIPSRDYYSLYGVFASAHEPGEPPLLESKPRETPESLEFQKELATRLADVERFKEKRRGEILADMRTEKRIADYLEASLVPGDPGQIGRDRVLSGHMIQRYRVWLATTKADPAFTAWHALAALPEKDFAALASSTVAQVTTGVRFDRPPRTRREVAERYAHYLEGRPVGALDLPASETEAIFDGKDQGDLRGVRKKVDELKATHPGAPPRAMCLEENDRPFDPYVFIRGNPDAHGPPVPRQFLACLDRTRAPWKTGGRLELARAIASRENPLTARVFVNRALLYLLGAPLVRTPSDFGLRSEPPTNPGLLDHLARRFMDEGWSVKKLLRAVLLSATYRQASGDRPEARAVDPENLLLWRANRKRLDFEATRDALLAVSGALDLTLGGRAVELDKPRRSLYVFVDRQNLPAVFRTFDFASPDASSPRRLTTSVPQQALFFMNSDLVRDAAKKLAARAPSIDALYALALERAPSDDERALGEAFVKAAPPESDEPAWSYGWGSVEGKRVARFTPLPHWSGSQWQGGAAIPDPRIAWCLLSATGGHPGRDQKHAIIRRFTSPIDGVVAISGTVVHPEQRGDGVRARVISSEQGELGSWVVKGSSAAVSLLDVRVHRGATIDFVVDCRESDSYDSFSWAPTIEAADGDGDWDAARDFRGPRGRSTPWERYAQVLLETNEFEFED